MSAPGPAAPDPAPRPREAGTLVLGHRGASAHALENTIAAFARARADGADGVELDVRLTTDGALVVFHDDDLHRLAGRPGRVEDLPLAGVREVALVGGERIPTLDEVLETLGPGLLVNAELKARDLATALRLGRAAARWARARPVGDRLIASSFHPVALASFRAAAPELATGLLFAAQQPRPLRDAWARPLLRPRALHPEHVLVTPERLAGWRRAGYGVNVWTVDDPAELRRLAALRVDAIIANDPAAARRVLSGEELSPGGRVASA